MSTLGQLLRKARESAGLNQTEASKKSKLSQGKISALETQETDAKLSTLRKLSKAYGVTISQLLEGLK